MFLCKQIIESGILSFRVRINFIIFEGNADVVMAVGFEKMASGSLEAMQPSIDDRALPIDKHIQVMSDSYGYVLKFISKHL
jgi:hypothetical protein